jgi:mono/diheme cytochrome c family protein
MNYPVWELYASGGGLWIAIIAVIHVYIAHFAVGGGLYLVLCEQNAYREKNDEFFIYLRKHARFFMLLTMVLGGGTGVGIWFTMTLLSPEASSVLIHHFVFAWAVEWLFFTCEIITLFLYYYTFDRIQPEIHIRIGWFYFGFAWLSLLVVNGIISFMITPGQWLETGNFWHGFFNPGFLPSLLFRTALTIVFAGIFGLLTTTYITQNDFRNQQSQFCGKWILSGLLSLPIFAHFYFYSLPDMSEKMIKGASPELQPFVLLFIILFVMLVVSGIIIFANLSQKIQQIIAYSLLMMGLLYMGSFEWIREGSRKPYIIYNYLYANQMYKKDTKTLKERGILKNAKWVVNKTISSNNRLDAGHELFMVACSSCHSIGGPMNDIVSLSQNYSIKGMDSALIGMGKITPYMPEFYGTPQERTALAHYIVENLHHHQTTVESAPLVLTLTHSNLPFDEKNQKHILLAWPDKGMHLHAGSTSYFTLGSSSGTIQAQLIKRGELPEHVSDGVDIIYHCENQDVKGSMHYDDISMAFVATNIHLSEFDKTNHYNPYPMIIVEARDKETKECLATTQLVFAISSAMGCKKCHAGKWEKYQSEISKETAKNILETHDRISGTSLYKTAKNGENVSCAHCHASFSCKENANHTKNLNLSASIHGFHANYIDDTSSKACLNCHAELNGDSLCYRGIHSQIGLSCVDCHGSLSDHAISLLVYEKNSGKMTSQRYLNHLSSDSMADMNDIQPRKSWVQEPDCKTCHINYNQPDDILSGFNQWTSDQDSLFRNQMGDAGIRCTACHGVPHVIYPSNNIIDPQRDNSQPMQYQLTPIPVGGNNHCNVCHMDTIMEDNYHHDNMMNDFRNVHLIDSYK